MNLNVIVNEELNYEGLATRLLVLEESSHRSFVVVKPVRELKKDVGMVYSFYDGVLESIAAGDDYLLWKSSNDYYLSDKLTQFVDFNETRIKEGMSNDKVADILIKRAYKRVHDFSAKNDFDCLLFEAINKKYQKNKGLHFDVKPYNFETDVDKFIKPEMKNLWSRYIQRMCKRTNAPR